MTMETIKLNTYELPPDAVSDEPISEDDREFIDEVRTILPISMADPEIDVKLTLDFEGIGQLDRLILSSHNSDPVFPVPAKVRGTSIMYYGIYIGECLIAEYGGSWVRVDGNLCLRINDSVLCNPIGKVAKMFANGEEDSVLGFARLFGPLLKMTAEEIDAVGKAAE